jgi:hypothetical protein
MTSPNIMDNPWAGLDDNTRAILDGHGEGVVAVRPSLVRALKGNGNAAILLAELMYWSKRLGDPEGRFYQTQRRLQAQTGLGPDAQRKAIRLLERLGVLDTVRQGIPAKIYSWLDLPRLAALLSRHHLRVSVADHGPTLEAEHGRAPEPGHGPQPDVGHSPRQAADHGPHHKEIKTDIKEENKGSTPLPPHRGRGLRRSHRPASRRPITPCPMTSW